MTDLADLVQNPALRWGLGAEGTIGLRVDALREATSPSCTSASSAATAAAPASTTGGRRRARCSRRARARAARARRRGGLCGYSYAVTPGNAPPAAEEDPVLGPWLGARARARARAARRSSGATRSTSRASREGDVTSPVLALANLATVLRSGLRNPRWSYLPIDPQNEAAVEFATRAHARTSPSSTSSARTARWSPGSSTTARRDDRRHRPLGLRRARPARPGGRAAAPAGRRRRRARRAALRSTARPSWRRRRWPAARRPRSARPRCARRWRRPPPPRSATAPTSSLLRDVAAPRLPRPGRQPRVGRPRPPPVAGDVLPKAADRERPRRRVGRQPRRQPRAARVLSRCDDPETAEPRRRSPTPPRTCSTRSSAAGVADLRPTPAKIIHEQAKCTVFKYLRSVRRARPRAAGPARPAAGGARALLRPAPRAQPRRAPPAPRAPDLPRRLRPDLLLRPRARPRALGRGGHPDRGAPRQRGRRRRARPDRRLVPRRDHVAALGRRPTTTLPVNSVGARREPVRLHAGPPDGADAADRQPDRRARSSRRSTARWAARRRRSCAARSSSRRSTRRSRSRSRSRRTCTTASGSPRSRRSTASCRGCTPTPAAPSASSTTSSSASTTSPTGTWSSPTSEIDLADVRVPVLSVAGETDVLAPQPAVHHVGELLPNSPDVRLESAPGGHLGVLTGRSAQAHDVAVHRRVLRRARADALPGKPSCGAPCRRAAHGYPRDREPSASPRCLLPAGRDLLPAAAAAQEPPPRRRSRRARSSRARSSPRA